MAINRLLDGLPPFTARGADETTSIIPFHSRPSSNLPSKSSTGPAEAPAAGNPEEIAEAVPLSIRPAVRLASANDYLQDRAKGSTLYGFRGGPAGFWRSKVNWFQRLISWGDSSLLSESGSDYSTSESAIDRVVLRAYGWRSGARPDRGHGADVWLLELNRRKVHLSDFASERKEWALKEPHQPLPGPQVWFLYFGRPLQFIGPGSSDISHSLRLELDD
ncbi:hypothetical protein HPP92_017265 [Vanilla planifolia]|uniref:Uncharacterized protein n=1 Tax=Vanilla planifolia TaxID=51239 RepID=A0A835QHD4_VANPL|nr:hypothetical protein HPP92_017265 [Vanilla planifolia]